LHPYESFLYPPGQGFIQYTLVQTCGLQSHVLPDVKHVTAIQMSVKTHTVTTRVPVDIRETRTAVKHVTAIHTSVKNHTVTTRVPVDIRKIRTDAKHVTAIHTSVKNHTVTTRVPVDIRETRTAVKHVTAIHTSVQNHTVTTRVSRTSLSYIHRNTCCDSMGLYRRMDCSHMFCIRTSLSYIHLDRVLYSIP
jgi:antitoxin component of RelBE/YafQ-DinJ toxin-antitoxin module